MGTCTVAIDKDGRSQLDSSDHGVMVLCKISMSSSYQTGGDLLPAALFSLGQVAKLMVNNATLFGGAEYEASPIYGAPNSLSNLQVMTGAGVEVANGTNLTGLVFDAIAFGQ